MEYDLDLASDELTPEFIHSLSALSPTGCENPTPLFRMRANVVSPRAVGADHMHLKFSLKTDSGYVEAIWFRKAEMINTLPRLADVVFEAEINEYQGRSIPQVRPAALLPVTGACIADAATRAESLFQAFLTDAVYNRRNTGTKSHPLSAKAFADVFNAQAKGVLVVAATAEDAKNALYLASPTPETSYDVTVGCYPSDKRCFRAIAIAPTGSIPKGYDTVIAAGIPDGLIDANFTIDTMPPCAMFMRMPTLERLRNIYATARKLVRRPYYFSGEQMLVKSIAEEADVNEITAAAGLMVLSDMELLIIKKSPNQVVLELPEMVKKNPEDNELYNLFTQWKNEAAEGGGRNA